MLIDLLEMLVLWQYYTKNETGKVIMNEAPESFLHSLLIHISIYMGLTFNINNTLKEVYSSSFTHIQEAISINISGFMVISFL